MKLFKVNILLLTLVFLGTSACNTKTAEEKGDEADSVLIVDTEANWDGCMVSAYVFQEDGRHLPENSLQIIKDFESLVEHDLGSAMWYPTFADPFPLTECKEMQKEGLIPHLTWELFWPDSVDYNTMPIEGNYKVMDEVLAGKHDAYIEQFAKDAKEFGDKVMIRFLHEFNGNWYLWGGNKNGREIDGPQKVVAVWKYVVDKFRAEGADNVKWIWNPHGPSIDVSLEAWNDLANYWPGDEYVDWIGMDAYNWYPKDPWGGERPYRDFDNCFKDLYTQCIELGNQPIMIAEFASPEFDYEGTNKVDWVNDAFDKMKNDYPRIKMFIWFQINKELDWRVNSSPEVLEAFKTNLQDPYFIGRAK